MNPLAALLVALSACVPPAQAPAQERAWKAGTATVKITPEGPVWMSGYPRDHPAEGTLQDLWAKALALEDATGRRALLITMDLVGIDRATSLRVCAQIATRHGLKRDQVALCMSHTHCGPAIGRNLDGLLALDEVQRRHVDDYTDVLADKLVALAGAALAQLRPATLAWGQGHCAIAVNRRTNPRNDVEQLRAAGRLQGPSDHDVPALAVRDPEGKLQAVVFGYACHATVLDVSYQWCGDYPGYAQAALEAAHPGAVALFWAGCGGDQAPRPRETVALCETYGRRLAGAVDEVLAGVMQPLSAALATTYDEIPLRLAEPPGRDVLEKDTKSSNTYIARRAGRLLAELDAGRTIRRSYPYPVQLWRLGDLCWVLLGGEVVVDYALRLKQELGPMTWVAAYANDVMAYIPSLRVLREGGYEGANAMVYYNLPGPWSEDVEAQIIGQVTQASRRLSVAAGPSTEPVRALLLTGGHEHDVAFYTLFLGDRDLGRLPVDSAANAFQKDLRGKYDVLIMYDFTRDLDDAARKNLRDFVESGKGVVVLHHALLNYQDWAWWSEEVVGGRYRLKREGASPSSGVKDGVEFKVKLASAHPVLAGLGSFQITDEAYKNMYLSPRIQPLLVTDNPASDSTLAWIGPCTTARVVAIQLGHGPSAFAHPTYRALVHNAILWAARRRPD
jgi:type 1 glutamine amidotransferase